MNQLPLPPFDAPPEPARSSAAGPMPRPKRRSVFGRVFRGIGWLGSSPIQWMGVKSIRRGASFIGDLVERVRVRPQRDPRLKTAEHGEFDLGATARSLGITVAELQRRLEVRRRETALTSYLMAGLGAMFLVAWLVKALRTPMTGGRVLLAFDFLPLCVLFVLLAFYQALVNFQIRVGRAAGWREYLTTEDEFWPRT